MPDQPISSKRLKCLVNGAGLDASVEASIFAMELVKLGMLDERQTDRVFEASDRYENDKLLRSLIV
jgi:hypothetical protein